MFSGPLPFHLLDNIITTLLMGLSFKGERPVTFVASFKNVNYALS